MCYARTSFTREEARAWGIEIAQKEMPEAEGYYDHNASADSIPADKVGTLLRMIDAGEFDREIEPLESFYVRGDESEEREM
jgi:hypothetical protein